MSLPRAESDQIHAWASEVSDGTISADEFNRLATTLRSNEAARQLYAESLYLHVFLEDTLGGQAPNEQETALVPVTATPNLIARLTLRPTTLLGRSLVWTLGIAVSLIGLYVGVLFWDLRNHPERAHVADAEASAVAEIFAANNAKWKSPLKVVHDRVTAGEMLELVSGTVELQLMQGARITVEGPAKWSADDKNSATLKHGKLFANVPKQAVGFALNTPTARIVDLGTEFGAEVTDSGTEIHVIRGSVEAMPREGASSAVATSAGSSVKIGKGSAVQIASGPMPQKKIAFDQHRFDFAARKMPVASNLIFIDFGRNGSLGKASGAYGLTALAFPKYNNLAIGQQNVNNPAYIGVAHSTIYIANNGGLANATSVNLVDTNSNRTGISLSFEARRSNHGADTASVGTSGSAGDYSGTVPPDAADLFAASASRDAIYLLNSAVLVVTLSNLDPARKYDLTAFSGRDSGSMDHGGARYVLTTGTARVSQFQNASGVYTPNIGQFLDTIGATAGHAIQWLNVSPSAEGQITFEVRTADNAGYSVAALNALAIKTVPEQGASTTLPSDVSAGDSPTENDTQ